MNSSLVRQGNFSGGEIAPLAYGATDTPAYQHGLRLCRNFWPTVEGQLVNRTGTRLVAKVKDPNASPRLIPFIFSDGQTFILEVGNLYIRFFQNGGPVLLAGVPYEIVTPWAIADVPRLKFAQNGDIITFCCLRRSAADPNYQPQELARISNTNWTLTAVSYSSVAWTVWQSANNGGVSVSNGSLSSMVLPHSPADYTTKLGAAVSCSDFWLSGVVYAYGQFVLVQPGGAGTRVHLWQSAITSNQGNSPGGNINPLTGSDRYWIDWTFWTGGGGPTYRRSDYIWQSSDGQPTSNTDGVTYLSLVDNNTDHDPVNNSPTQWAVADDSTRPPKNWQFVVTLLYKDANGVVHETLGSPPTPPTMLSVYSDRPVSITWNISTLSVPPFAPTLYNIYGGRNGIYGLLGTAPVTNGGASGSQTFTYDGLIPPDYGTQPPRGTNPFDVANPSVGGTAVQSWPGVFTYAEQRAIYARSLAKPQDFWGSAVGLLKNFDVNVPAQPEDTYNFTIASERLEDIRSIIGLRNLIVFTGNGVWGAEGAAGAITDTSVFLRRYNDRGAAYLDPLIIDRAAIYLTNRGRVRDLQWEWRSQIYIGRDLSVVARHLYELHSITSWCYAETPYNLVFAVRDDGVLLTMTYSPAGIEAHAQHTTDGAFECVASVPETDATGYTEDAVYVVVRRIINGATARYIERFTSRIVPELKTVLADGESTFAPDVRPMNFLDCALQYDGRNSATTGGVVSLTLSGATYAAGDQLTASFTGEVVPLNGGVGPFNATVVDGIAGNIGGTVVIDPDGVAGGPYPATIVAILGNTSVTVQLDVPLPAAYQNIATQSFGVGALVLNGFTHLAGQSVNALIDGAAAGPFTVNADGTIVLGSPGVIVQAGLPYTSDMDLLDVAADQVKTNKKSVRKATFEVVTSRGLLAGETFAKLFAPNLQSVADGNSVPPLFTGNAEVQIASSWNTEGGRACLRQSDPLPLTVVAVVRDLEVGGR